MSQPSVCQENTQENETQSQNISVDERIKNYLNEHGIVRFGINTDIVFVKDYDTGFGFGMRLPKKALAPIVELTTSLNFWGASNDTLDVSYFGIEESLTLHKKPSDKVELFSGVSGGYYGKITSEQKVSNGTAYMQERQKNSFAAFVTIGLVYKINTDRSVFAQLKHGILKESAEIHLLAGIYFH